jgi:hypothetical protein
MENKELYASFRANIISYFANTHSPEVNYQIIKQYIGI